MERELRARGVATRRLERRPFELEAVDLAGASALVLAADDDGLNVSLALRGRRWAPDLHVVVRVFDAALVNYLTEALPDVRILSMSSVTAPAIAQAARTVLDRAENAARVLVKGVPTLRRRQSRVDYTLVWALAALFLLVFPSAAFFSHALGIRYMDALYFVWTTVMTVGYGDIALKDASDGAKLFGMFLMLSGATFIAILFALLSDWVLSRRLEMLQGRTPERGSGHVIIAGAGNIGVRVAQLLQGSGQRLVILERHAESRNARALAAQGHHVIVADATAEETLALAALPRAALVLALTDSDAVNVQVAFHARRCGVPVIMRADSAELAAHMAERGDAIALSPVTAATDAFVDAAMQAASLHLPETLPR